jgi:hypothetical protein
LTDARRLPARHSLGHDEGHVLFNQLELVEVRHDEVARPPVVRRPPESSPILGVLHGTPSMALQWRPDDCHQGMNMNDIAAGRSMAYESKGTHERVAHAFQCASRAIAMLRREPVSFTDRMRIAFSATGGMLHADALSHLLRKHTDQPISRLARWIVDRRIVSFEADSQRWIPMFQFGAPDLCMLDGVARSILELRDIFDDQELAEWFAMPNTWLTGRAPSRVVRGEADAVVGAARADRFVVSG